MDADQRKQLEDATREGLAKIGASAEEIAWALEPGIPDAELARRAMAVTDKRIQARLGEAGLRPDEAAAVMDTSGTPAEREARRNAALQASVARQLSDPATMDALIGQMLEDPAMRERIVAEAVAEAKKQRRKRLGLAVGAIVALGVAGFVGYRALRPSPCAKLLGTDAELSAVFGTPVVRTKIFDSKYFCHVDVEDAGTHQRLAFVTIENASHWSRNHSRLSPKEFASVEPAGIGDTSELGIAGPKKEVPTDMGSLLERRRRGSRDPMGDALAAMGPAGHTLNARAGDGMIVIVFYGAEAQARAVTTWLGARLEPVRSSSYR